MPHWENICGIVILPWPLFSHGLVLPRDMATVSSGPPPPPLVLQHHQNKRQIYTSCSTFVGNSTSRKKIVSQSQTLLFVDTEFIPRRIKSTIVTSAAATTNITSRADDHRLERWPRKRHSQFAVYESIKTLCRYGLLKEALSILQVMDCGGAIPVDTNIYDFLLQACSDMKALEEGKRVHDHMRSTGSDQSVFLRTKLVNMYARCGSLTDARLIFDGTSQRTSFLWNAMIRGYTMTGFFEEEALNLYYQMKRSGMRPDVFTFSHVLKACAGLSDLQKGKEIHSHAIRRRVDSNLVVGSALIDMYWKCGCIEAARQVFVKMSERDVVCWTAMIAGLTHNQLPKSALKIFRQMQIEGVKPNSVTVLSVLPACGDLGALQQGREIHGYVIRGGFDSYISVGSALVDLYSKCSCIDVARQVFEKMSERNEVLWSSMIVGCAQNGRTEEALDFFRQMQWDGVKPNSVTLQSVLSVCGGLAALQQGKEHHAYAIRNGFESEEFVCCALIEMYAKCGSIENAHIVFEKMPERNVVSWNSMIDGYGLNRRGEEAITIFCQMEQAGLKPNQATFVAVLSACSRAGLVAEGWQYFNCMSRNYHITPTVEHYACMVDLLGHAGLLHEAQSFIQIMPLEPDAGVWRALLVACSAHCNIEIGEYAAEHLFQLEPKNARNYALLSSMYVAASRWDDVAKVRTMTNDRGLNMGLGCN